MQNKKVCFIVTDAISFQMLCRGQFEYFRDNSNFEMTFISGGNSENFIKIINRNVGNVFDAKMVRKPSFFKDVRSLVLLSRYFVKNRFDLVIYSTPKALLLGSIASAITFHNNSISIIRGRAYENSVGLKRKFYQFLDKISLINSKKVIFISKSLMDIYIKEGLVNSDKSILLGSGSSNGVNTDRFKPKSLQSSQLENCVYNKKDPFTVLIAGRICADKGINDFAEIIKHIIKKNIVFKLVGPIEDKQSEKILYELMSKYPNIEHIPYTDNIEKYFQEANLHLFLTHREGFGNVAIEAASCGVPTFAYNVIGVCDSVKDGVSGRKFNIKDYKLIAQKIEQASIDPNFNKKFVQAREWAIENFAQKKVWDNYLSFYKSMTDIIK